MVEIDHSEQATTLLLHPNRSMSWEANKKILLAMFCVNISIGLSFAMIGAWLILPFAGLEIVLVGIGMYYVCWKLNFKEVITIEAESLTLQKGVYYPKQTWHWQKSYTALVKQPSSYRMSAPKLFLQHLNETVEVGAFLNRKDKKLLRDNLQQRGIPIIGRASSI